MKISDNEAHSATYRSENEHFARRCRHYKSKDCKAEWLGGIFSWLGMGYGDRFLHQKWLD